MGWDSMRFKRRRENAPFGPRHLAAVTARLENWGIDIPFRLSYKETSNGTCPLIAGKD